MSKQTSSKFGDKRLGKAFGKLLLSMQSRETVVIRQLADTASNRKQHYRFINNKGVKTDSMLEHYWQESTSDFSGMHLLVIGDTTTLTLPPNKNRTDIPLIRGNTTKCGFDLHACIMVDAALGGCYGFGGVSFYTKKKVSAGEEEQTEKLARRKEVWKLPLEQKERAKWFTTPCKAIANCPGAGCYTLVGDREADIYDLMAKVDEKGWGFLYRSRCDRSLSSQTKGEETLYRLLEKQEVAHSYKLNLRATKKRSAHVGLMDVKYAKVSVKQPKNKKDPSLPMEVEMYVVEVKERPDTVIKREKSVHWILLTSHPVASVEDAIRIVQWYTWRWIIEQVFRTMKTEGLNIEASEVETLQGLKVLSTMACIAALSIMQLVQARDGNTKQTMEQVFLEKEQLCILSLNTKLEGRTEKLKNPHPKDSLAYASWVIARLGGWSGYQSERPPGPLTMINGLIRFFDILVGYQIDS